MTLGELRAQTAAAWAEAKENNIILRTYQGHNMWESWDMCAFVVQPMLGNNLTQVVDARILRFYYAGDTYYYARRHGLQAAMLRKLSRP